MTRQYSLQVFKRVSGMLSAQGRARGCVRHDGIILGAPPVVGEFLLDVGLARGTGSAFISRH